MSNKSILLLLILTLITSLKAEIIHISKLESKIKPFVFTRDLFSPKRTKMEIINKNNFEKKEMFKIKEEKLKRKHEEIFDNIIYEGFVLRKNIKTVLLSINGEFATCREGDIILDKIEIVKVSLKTLSIKIENKKYDINLKENEDEEK